VAADRRLVHTLLRDWAGLQTISIDEDPESGMKRVQISRVGYVPGSKQQGRAPGEPDAPDAEPFPPETDDDEAPPEPFPPVEE
jgi:hypothetical protein